MLLFLKKIITIRLIIHFYVDSSLEHSLLQRPRIDGEVFVLELQIFVEIVLRLGSVNDQSLRPLEAVAEHELEEEASVVFVFRPELGRFRTEEQRSRRDLEKRARHRPDVRRSVRERVNKEIMKISLS